jgi:urease accessory protein UreF
MTAIPQLTTESAKAYAAFVAYAQLGPERSHEGVARRCSKSIGLIHRWSRTHSWVTRVRAYDAELVEAAAEQHRAQYLADLEAHRTRSMQMGRALFALAAKLLNRLQAEIETVEVNANTLTLCAKAIVTAADLEAHALGIEQLFAQFDEPL